MDEDIVWKILDKYFEDNPSALVNHHLESYNDFFNGGINKIFREKNPIKKVRRNRLKNNQKNLKNFLKEPNGEKKLKTNYTNNTKKHVKSLVSLTVKLEKLSAKDIIENLIQKKTEAK